MEELKEKKWFTTYEVARILDVSPMTVWRWCKSGKIKAVKTPGGYYSIPREEVEKILRQMRGE